MAERAIGPIEMGRQLVEALGLKGINGILRLQINCEGGKIPTLTVVRTITHEQAGAVCARLVEWNCELLSVGPSTERDISADGSVSEARTPLSPSRHPREG